MQLDRFEKNFEHKELNPKPHKNKIHRKQVTPKLKLLEKLRIMCQRLLFQILLVVKFCLQRPEMSNYSPTPKEKERRQMRG